MKILKPNKYTDINLSVIGLSAEILKSLRTDSHQRYSVLLEKIIVSQGLTAKENFLLSLCFLFSLGKINYYPQQDIIELK